jgi:predicted ribosomally synthesized peptide with nif11-like leader
MHIRRKERMMDYGDLSSELQKRVASCESPEEILELAKAEGYEFSVDELEAVSGGWRGRCDDYNLTGPL